MLVGAYTYPRLEAEVTGAPKKKKGKKSGPQPDDGHPGHPQPDGGHPGDPRPDGGHPGDPRPDGGHPGDPRPDGEHPGDPRPDGGHPGDPRPDGGHPGDSRPDGGRPEEDPDQEDLLQALLGDDQSCAEAVERDGGDPFEEEPEDEAPVVDESDLRGLSQEEFEKIFHEVGDGSSLTPFTFLVH